MQPHVFMPRASVTKGRPDIEAFQPCHSEGHSLTGSCERAVMLEAGRVNSFRVEERKLYKNSIEFGEQQVPGQLQDKYLGKHPGTPDHLSFSPTIATVSAGRVWPIWLNDLLNIRRKAGLHITS